MRKISVLCLILLMGISVLASYGGMPVSTADVDNQNDAQLEASATVGSFTIVTELEPLEVSFLNIEDAPITEYTSSELAGF